MAQKSKHCRNCNCKTLHVRQHMITDGMGCLLTILTGGLFLLVWFPLAAIDLFCQPWRCQMCGQKN